MDRLQAKATVMDQAPRACDELLKITKTHETSNLTASYICDNTSLALGLLGLNMFYRKKAKDIYKQKEKGEIITAWRIHILIFSARSHELKNRF